MGNGTTNGTFDPIQSSDINLGATTATPTPTPVGSPTPSTTQGYIYGDVVNTKGEPIAKAKVQILSKETGFSDNYTTNDTDGYFEFTDLDAGTYKMTVTKKGYRQYKAKVTLKEGEILRLGEIVLPKAKKKIGAFMDEDDQ